MKVSTQFTLSMYCIISGSFAILGVSTASLLAPVPYFEAFFSQDLLVKLFVSLGSVFLFTCSYFLLWVNHRIEHTIKKQKTLLEVLKNTVY